MDLQNLQAGNWVVFRNGKRRQVRCISEELGEQENWYNYNVAFFGKSRMVPYLSNGSLFKGKRAIIDHRDIVSVWDHRPKRREIMAMIKKGSFVNFRDGRREKVTRIKRHLDFFSYFITTNGSRGSHSEKGRFLTSKSDDDLVSVESLVSNDVEGLLM